MSDWKRRVLVTGDLTQPDFGSVNRWLGEVAIINVVEQAQPGDRCDLAIIFQSRPGQVSQAEVESLHGQVPLSPLLAILGSWCEGETRSGKAWHGVERVFWYEAISRLTPLLAPGGQAVPPRTETAADRWNRQLGGCSHLAIGGNASIVASTRSAFESVSDACRLLGYMPTWRRPGEVVAIADPDLVIWDAQDVTSAWLDDYLALRRAWRKSQFVALLNFPRRDAIRRLESLGCQTVLGKPFSILDLAASLRAQRTSVTDNILRAA